MEQRNISDSDIDVSLDVVEHFTDAVGAIDAAFERGYAKDHPELIVAFMQAYAVDRQNEVLVRGFESLVCEVRHLRTRPHGDTLSMPTVEGASHE